MKYTVKNNSNAPHDLMTLKGRVVVLAGKSVEVDFDAGSLDVYEAVPFFEVKYCPEVGDVAKYGVVAHVGPPPVELPPGSRVVSIPAPSAENNEPIRRKPGRPAKASA